MAVEASNSLSLLVSAKDVLFGNGEVPCTTGERRHILRTSNTETQAKRDKELDVLDRAFWADPAKLGEKMSQFVKDYDLHRNF